MLVLGNVFFVILVILESGVNLECVMDVVVIRRVSGDRSGGQMVVIVRMCIILMLFNWYE